MAVFNISFMSKSLWRTVHAYVVLPTDKVYFPGMKKREEGKPYKTLYLLHGMIGNDTDWLYGTRIQRWAEERDLCVVMPAGENAFYLDYPERGEMFGQFIGQELVDFTRKTFPLSTKKEDTYIGGLSMGGFGAMRNGLKYHDTFGAIISLSGGFLAKEERPALFPMAEQLHKAAFGQDYQAAYNSDKNPVWIARQMAAKKIAFPPIYMACGQDDDLLPVNNEVADILKECGAPLTYEIGPGSHEWDFWDTYIKKALDFLPLEEGAEGATSGHIKKD